MFSVRTEPSKSERVWTIPIFVWAVRECLCMCKCVPVYTSYNQSILISLCSVPFFLFWFMCDRLTSNDRNEEKRNNSQNFVRIVAAVRLVSNWNQSVCLLACFCLLFYSSSYNRNPITNLSFSVCMFLFIEVQAVQLYRNSAEAHTHTVTAVNRANGTLTKSMQCNTMLAFATFFQLIASKKLTERTYFFEYYVTNSCECECKCYQINSSFSHCRVCSCVSSCNEYFMGHNTDLVFSSFYEAHC